jgi:hypothetical protein
MPPRDANDDEDPSILLVHCVCKDQGGNDYLVLLRGAPPPPTTRATPAAAAAGGPQAPVANGSLAPAAYRPLAGVMMTQASAVEYT